MNTKTKGQEQEAPTLTIAFGTFSHARRATIFTTPFMAQLHGDRFAGRQRILTLNSQYATCTSNVTHCYLHFSGHRLQKKCSFLPQTHFVGPHAQLLSGLPRLKTTRQRSSDTVKTTKSDTSLAHTPIHKTLESCWCSSRKATFIQRLLCQGNQPSEFRDAGHSSTATQGSPPGHVTRCSIMYL